MVLEWKEEEKTLLNMKKIIAAVWRMNRQQLYAYYRRMQKKQPEILPGQIGIVFLKKLKHIADGDTDAVKVWPDAGYGAHAETDTGKPESGSKSMACGPAKTGSTKGALF